MLPPALLKLIVPQVEPLLNKGMDKLKEHLKSIELEPGETEAAVLLGIDAKNDLQLGIVIFKLNEISRVVSTYDKSDLKKLIEKAI